MLRAPLPTTLNYNLAIHSNDSFWIVQKDQASLSAVRLTTPRRPVQTGRLHSLQGRVQCELPRTNLETKSAQTIPPPDRRSMRRRRLLMGALGALMLMGVARKVMLGKTGRFVRSFASLPALSREDLSAEFASRRVRSRCRCGFAQSLAESGHTRTRAGRPIAEVADHRHGLLLCARREGPRGRGAAENPYELTAPHARPLDPMASREYHLTEQFPIRRTNGGSLPIADARRCCR